MANDTWDLVPLPKGRKLVKNPYMVGVLPHEKIGVLIFDMVM